MRPSARFRPFGWLLARLTADAIRVAVILAAASPALAEQVQPVADAQAASRTALDELLAKRKELAAQIAALGKRDPSAATGTDSLDVSTTEDELEFLETLDGVYGEQQSRLEQRQELLLEKQRTNEDLEALRKFGPTEAKPYSFLLLEELRDDLAAEDDHEEVNSADLKTASQMKEATQAQYDKAERERRRIQEALNDNKHKERQADLATDLKLAQRESQIAKELIAVRQFEAEVRTLRHDIGTLRKTLLTEKIELVGRDVRFGKQDLQDRLKELTAVESELNARLKEVRSQRRQTEQQEAAAVKQLRERKAPQATIDWAAQSWHVARDSQQIEMSLLNEEISDTRRFRHYWECRFAAETGTATPAEAAEWRETLNGLVSELRDRQRSLQQLVETTRLEQGKVAQRMRDNEDAELKKWGDFQCERWQEVRETCETHLVRLKVNERWARRFLGELDARLDSPQVSWMQVATERFTAAWYYEVVKVNDRPITVGKIVTLVCCLFFSVASARLLSRLLGRHILPRLGLNEGASHAVRSMAFYSLAVLFGVLSFQIVHIPLSAFTFLGGAVAIAVGFGSQDIANNFMSGIILLAEQPIRVGDIIMVDSVQGTVDHIGPRSTRIKTDANHELVVPNSKLLSDKVTNLTLSDCLVQTTVLVTLPLKMTVKEAKGVLLAAALSQNSVLRNPYPIVLLKQFGATSMDLELHFWLQLHNEMQVALAQSDVREAINELCQEHDTQAAIANAPASGLPPLSSRANAA